MTEDIQYKYIVSIGSEGFESLIPIPDNIGKEDEMMATLAEDEEFVRMRSRISSQITAAGIHNRVNMHRNIKSYIIIVPYEPTEFCDMLQESAALRDLVCAKGDSYRI